MRARRGEGPYAEAECAANAAEALRSASLLAERDSLLVTNEELQQELKLAMASGKTLQDLQEQLESQRILWPMVQHEARRSNRSHSK